MHAAGDDRHAPVYESRVPNKPFWLTRDGASIAPINHPDLLRGGAKAGQPAGNAAQIIAAAKGTPADTVNRLSAEVGKVSANPEVRKAWAAQGATAMTMGVDASRRHTVGDVTRWARIATLSGPKVE